MIIIQRRCRPFPDIREQLGWYIMQSMFVQNRGTGSNAQGGALDAGPPTTGSNCLSRCGGLFPPHGPRRQRDPSGTEGPPPGPY